MEKWTKWIPVKDMPIPSDIKSVLMDDSGFLITLTDNEKKKKIIFFFEGSLYSYRFTDEGCFLKTLDYLSKHYEPNLVHGTSLYKVENSQYLAWFNEESYNAYANQCEHYVIYTENDIIEILSPYPPKVTLENI